MFGERKWCAAPQSFTSSANLLLDEYHIQTVAKTEPASPAARASCQPLDAPLSTAPALRTRSLSTARSPPAACWFTCQRRPLHAADSRASVARYPLPASRCLPLAARFPVLLLSAPTAAPASLAAHAIPHDTHLLPACRMPHARCRCTRHAAHCMLITNSPPASRSFPLAPRCPVSRPFTCPPLPLPRPLPARSPLHVARRQQMPTVWCARSPRHIPMEQDLVHTITTRPTAPVHSAVAMASMGPTWRESFIGVDAPLMPSAVEGNTTSGHSPMFFALDAVRTQPLLAPVIVMGVMVATAGAGGQDYLFRLLLAGPRRIGRVTPYVRRSHSRQCVQEWAVPAGTPWDAVRWQGPGWQSIRAYGGWDDTFGSGGRHWYRRQRQPVATCARVAGAGQRGASSATGGKRERAVRLAQCMRERQVLNYKPPTPASRSLAQPALTNVWRTSSLVPSCSLAAHFPPFTTRSIPHLCGVCVAQSARAQRPCVPTAGSDPTPTGGVRAVFASQGTPACSISTPPSPPLTARGILHPPSLTPAPRAVFVSRGTPVRGRLSLCTVLHAPQLPFATPAPARGVCVARNARAQRPPPPLTPPRARIFATAVSDHPRARHLHTSAAASHRGVGSVRMVLAGYETGLIPARPKALHDIAAVIKSPTHFMRIRFSPSPVCDITAVQRNDGNKQRPSESERSGALVARSKLTLERSIDDSDAGCRAKVVNVFGC
ncbi:hypothetical protein GGX14DRAFT_401407 [Mycena pura]|uniref:Uncharacterized protein n=1 Tax=Mycena pura TaxID=153505 RepID=A0AAD6YAL7_9AGAR|nr:hypothetical protein GGX14DRAFT_401407 [Mycena pura]